MTNIVWGARLIGSEPGSIAQFTSPTDNSGGSNVDTAVGAFTGLADLPTAMDTVEDFDAFAAALLAKTSESYNGGISVTTVSANRFYGVGGGGGDAFETSAASFALMYGRDGDDDLTSTGISPDTLFGGFGNDSLTGGNGDDSLDGGAGHDTIDGGANNDTASYAGAAEAVTVSLAQAGQQNTKGAGKDTLSGIESLVGSTKGDTLRGDSSSNRLYGGDGADTLGGGLGTDTLEGGAGSDVLDYRGVIGTGVTVSLAESGPQAVGAGMSHTLISINHLIGSRGNDSLTGNGGANRLDGGGGSDALAGGVGADTMIGASGKDLITGGANGDAMTGGAGKDRFVYNSIADTFTADADSIGDLEAQDRILLTNIDAKTDKDGNQAFELVAGLTGKSGQAALVYDSGADETELQLDVNGDGVADGIVVLTGNHTGFLNFAL